jgi:sodium/potassium-transporting ATPase subunit alpha
MAADRLSIAAKRMAKQNVLVKDLQGVETLGRYLSSSSYLVADALLDRRSNFCLSVLLSLSDTVFQLTLLATDKTGTLTRNQMTVTNLWSGGRMYSAFEASNLCFKPAVILS